jgi:O-antigen/teichoic acid export membrane protein
MNQSWIRFLPDFIRIKVEGRHVLQKTVGNTFWLLADNITRMGVGLLVGVWIARYLGPKQFGILNYSIAFVALFSTFATLGLDSIVVRNLVRNPSCKDEILASASALKLAGGLVTVLLAIGTILMLRPEDTLVHWMVGIIAVGTVFQSLDTIDFWFQSRVESQYTVYAKNGSFLIISGIKIILLLLSAPLIAFAWAGLAEIILGSIGLMMVYRLKGNDMKVWRATVVRAKSLLTDSWPLIFSGVAISIQAYIDQVMLGEMVGDTEVGQYSAALRIISVFGFVPMIIQSSAAPAITEAKNIDEELYYDRLLNLYRLMVIMFIVVSVPIFFLGKYIIIKLYGSQYEAAGILLSLFALRLFFTNFGVAKNLFITNENLFRYSLFTAVIGSIINIVLNYLLIPKYASIGAIWAMIASFFVTIFFVDVFFGEVRRNLWLMMKAIISPWKLALR